LPPLQNNDIRRLPSEKAKGIAGTAIIHLGVFLLLLLVAFTVSSPPKTELGILVNFGTDETGLGTIEPSGEPMSQDAAPPPPSRSPLQSDDQPLLTQNNEDAPEVKKADPDAEKKRREKIEADRIRREQLEEERIRKVQEEAERKRIEAEQQRTADIMNRTRNALANAKNSGTNSTSEGITGGAGNQGDPRGDVNSNVRGTGGGLGDRGSISYSLGGRGVQKLPSPKYDYQEEGRVVVDVSVDRQGKVVQAVPGGKGSTTLNEYLLKVAKDAALQAQFEVDANAAEVQKGTITYNFILK
jgi:outer membrane biosynthesis protein TonB